MVSKIPVRERADATRETRVKGHNAQPLEQIHHRPPPVFDPDAVVECAKLGKGGGVERVIQRFVTTTPTPGILVPNSLARDFSMMLFSCPQFEPPQPSPHELFTIS